MADLPRARVANPRPDAKFLNHRCFSPLSHAVISAFAEGSANAGTLRGMARELLRLEQGRSVGGALRRFETIPVDAELPQFRFEGLSRETKLRRGTGRAADDTMGLAECAFDDRLLVLSQINRQ